MKASWRCVSACVAALACGAAAAADGLRVEVAGRELPLRSFAPDYDVASFTLRTSVTVRVKAPAPVRRVAVSPIADGHRAEVDGADVLLRVGAPAKLIVKADGWRELVLVADGPDGRAPRPGDDGVAVLRAAAPSDRPSVSDELQRAIDAAHAAGGGTVLLTAGVHPFDRPIVLRGGVELYLAEGAVLKADASSRMFPVRGHKESIGLDFTWLIYTEEGARDVAIRGAGAIDASGREMRGEHALLATCVAPIGCENFTMEGVTVLDGAFWTVVPARCRNVTIRNVKVFNAVSGITENDAIDVCECSDVSVSDVVAVSEDDAFSVKTWSGGPRSVSRDWYGAPLPNERVRFEDCLGWSSCATFKVGDGCSRDQRDILFRRCRSYRSMAAMKVSHRYGTGVVERVSFEGIDVEGWGGRNRDFAWWFDLFVGSDGPVRDVRVRGVSVRPAEGMRARALGRSREFPCDGLLFEDVSVGGIRRRRPEELPLSTNRFVRGVEVR